MERALTLLPEPLSPTRQKVSPASRLSETPSTARNAFGPRPKSIWRSFISSKALTSMTKDEGRRTKETRRTKDETHAQWAVSRAAGCVVMRGLGHHSGFVIRNSDFA